MKIYLLHPDFGDSPILFQEIAKIHEVHALIELLKNTDIIINPQSKRASSKQYKYRTHRIRIDLQLTEIKILIVLKR